MLLVPHHLFIFPGRDGKEETNETKRELLGLRILQPYIHNMESGRRWEEEEKEGEEKEEEVKEEEEEEEKEGEEGRKRRTWRRKRSEDEKRL